MTTSGSGYSRGEEALRGGVCDNQGGWGGGARRLGCAVNEEVDRDEITRQEETAALSVTRWRPRSQPMGWNAVKVARIEPERTQGLVKVCPHL